MTALDPMQKLLIEADCKKQVLAAINATDRRDYSDMANSFTEDALLYRPMAPTDPIRGRKAIFDTYQKRPASRMTRHICSNFTFDIQSSERVLVTCYAQVYGADQTLDQHDHLGPSVDGKIMIGEFEDVCILDNGKWLIAERHARFVMHSTN